MTPLGKQIHQVAEKQSQILFQQQGQKIKFKEIGPRLNGFYTCVYRSSCDSEYRFIGKLILNQKSGSKISKFFFRANFQSLRSRQAEFRSRYNWGKS